MRIQYHHNSPFIIAEIITNHNGSIERALDTIKAAKAKAHAVKIQTYTLNTMTTDCNHKDFKIQKVFGKEKHFMSYMVKTFTPYNWHKKLFSYAQKLVSLFFLLPLTKPRDLLEVLDTPVYKIASFEITDLPLLSYVASKRKPMLISTGMATFEEIERRLKQPKLGVVMT